MRVGWRGALAAALFLGLTACGHEEPPVEDRGPPWFRATFDAQGPFLVDFGTQSACGVLAHSTELHDSPERDDLGALHVMKLKMTRLLSQPGGREPDGACSFVLRVEADEDVRWSEVAHVLLAVAGPEVKCYKLDLRIRGDDTPLRIDLPKSGMDMRKTHPDVVLPLRFFRRNALDPARAATLVRIGEADGIQLAPGGRPGQAAYTETWLAVERVLAKALAVEDVTRLDVRAPPPKGPRVPYGEIIRLLRKAREAGDYEITLPYEPWPSEGR